jgi:hypothetical protein
MRSLGLTLAATLAGCVEPEPPRLTAPQFGDSMADARPVDAAELSRWLQAGPADCEDVRGVLWTRAFGRDGSYADDGDEGPRAGRWRIDRRGLFCTLPGRGAAESCWQPAELEEEMVFIDLNGALRYACFRD